MKTPIFGLALYLFLFTSYTLASNPDRLTLPELFEEAELVVYCKNVTSPLAQFMGAPLNSNKRKLKVLKVFKGKIESKTFTIGTYTLSLFGTLPIIEKDKTQLAFLQKTKCKSHYSVKNMVQGVKNLRSSLLPAYERQLKKLAEVLKKEKLSKDIGVHKGNVRDWIIDCASTPETRPEGLKALRRIKNRYKRKESPFPLTFTVQERNKLKAAILATKTLNKGDAQLIDLLDWNYTDRAYDKHLATVLYNTKLKESAAVHCSDYLNLLFHRLGKSNRNSKLFNVLDLIQKKKFQQGEKELKELLKKVGVTKNWLGTGLTIPQRKR